MQTRGLGYSYTHGNRGTVHFLWVRGGGGGGGILIISEKFCMTPPPIYPWVPHQTSTFTCKNLFRLQLLGCPPPLSSKIFGCRPPPPPPPIKNDRSILRTEYRCFYKVPNKYLKKDGGVWWFQCPGARWPTCDRKTARKVGETWLRDYCRKQVLHIEENRKG